MTPERPATVPETARYDPNLPGWELAQENDAGERHGECRQYRDDGSLECIFRFKGGKRVGPFSSFHASGEVASRGDYVDDRLEGTFFKFVSKAPGSEPLRACCVPPSAVELRAEYRRGKLVTEVYYDEKGQPLKGDGTPWPPRPAGVPERATYDETVRRYSEKIEHDDGRGTIRYFGETGTIAEELSVRDARVVGRRRFDARGELREECGLESGVPHGAYREIVAEGATPYGDARIREVRGELLHGEARGAWEILDATGTVLRRVERGVPFADPPSLVLETEPPDVTPGELVERAVAARANGQAREAVCLAARAAARAGDPDVLRAFLADSVLPLAPSVAFERAEHVATLDKVAPSRLLDAVLAGGDAARLLRALPTTLPRSSRASLEYLDAALLLAPERTLTRMARALARVEHGDREGALGDADVVARDSTPAAELIREECRVAFAEFLFEPLEHPVEESDDELIPVTLEQPLEAIRRAVALYATRLSLIRAELRRRVGDAPWLPPALETLLSEGPVELRRYTATISDETDDGVFEDTTVSVDETLAVEGRSVRQLLEAARVDWSALSWLCWSVGLDEVALPTAIELRPLYAAAANRATLRCFWAFDRVRTGGLVALTRKVPLFTWEGVSIEKLPHHLAEVAASEYLEVRAQFLWSMFPENVSPFQADLRRI